jgi:DnaK suppressor protein
MPKTTKAAPAEESTKRVASRAKSATKEATGDRFLVEQRAELLVERASYVEAAESLRLDAEALAEDMEPGDIQFDEESGEGDTLNVERERDLALSAQARAAVDEIDRALAKMDAGTYGVCERCGNPIPKARLKALPYAALCVACKSGGLSRR